MNMRFDQVPIGGEFECQGERFKKIALSMTHDKRGWGVIFLYHHEVDYDGPPSPPAARTVGAAAPAGSMEQGAGSRG